MRIFLFFCTIFLLNNCSKPKTVFICGDHVCINKQEAKQFFEENLSIEVKIIDNVKKDKFDLVQLNMEQSKDEPKKISVSSKDKSKKNLKTLSKQEVEKIKKNIKVKNKMKKNAKKEIKTNQFSKKEISKIEKNKKIKDKEINKIETKNNQIIEKKNIVNRYEVVDICTKLKKCSIDEISKYLEKSVKKKGFPDITAKQ